MAKTIFDMGAHSYSKHELILWDPPSAFIHRYFESFTEVYNLQKNLIEIELIRPMEFIKIDFIVNKCFELKRTTKLEFLKRSLALTKNFADIA